MVQFKIPNQRKKIVAIDFEGTIVERKYPDIGAPKGDTISFIKRHRRKYTWILLTCREGEKLREAVEFLDRIGLQFDYVNDNATEVIEGFGYNPRKIYSDYYIDDRTAKIENLHRLV